MPASKAHKQAQALLEAQVAFFMKDLSPKTLRPMLKNEVENLFDSMVDLKLAKTVSEKKVKATAMRYAVDMEIGGGIPELFGEIAHVIFTYPTNETTNVGDIISDQTAEEFLNKIFETGSVLDHTVNNVKNSEAFRAFVSDLVVTVVKGHLLDQGPWLKNATLSKGTKAVRGWMNSLAPDLADNLEEKLHELTATAVANSLDMFDEVLDSQEYRDTAQNSTLALWDEVKTWPISKFRTYVTEDDLQDFMVLGYEFWLEFRQTEYLQKCIDTGVDFFFEKYGKATVGELLAEIGVTREMVVSEVMNYGPDLAKILVKEGVAEDFLRRHLGRFFESEQALAALK
ncbi:MAG: hypothetical protein R3194_00915 [Limnobacter sp.]|nr:hypothetical protein [Limnobacter sp.]